MLIINFRKNFLTIREKKKNQKKKKKKQKKKVKNNKRSICFQNCSVKLSKFSHYINNYMYCVKYISVFVNQC